MKIQSLSIVIPTVKCVNHCPFCVSKTHDNNYNITNGEFFNEDYIERLEYARDNGINVVILTGTGESLQNKEFIKKFSKYNNKLKRPFYNIELQTTGVYLNDETLEWLRKDIRVKTISLSVSDIFDNENNMNIIGVRKELRFNLAELVKKIKSYGFNTRLSLNVLKNIEKHSIEELFNKIFEFHFDQVTFRKLWKSNNNTNIDKWIERNDANKEYFDKINDYIIKNGKILGRLTFGALQYSLNEISFVVDDNCMDDKEIKEDIKYLILRENAKLYTKWDSPASLVF
jgi:sulfatase maturation enzyme AslB (radical SAM superfamily)